MFLTTKRWLLLFGLVRISVIWNEAVSPVPLPVNSTEVHDDCSCIFEVNFTSGSHCQQLLIYLTFIFMVHNSHLCLFENLPITRRLI